MTTKHTPGPWTVSDNHGKRYIEPVGDNAPVAMICRGHDDAYSANANLIAAAPELLEALEDCQTALEWAIEQGGGPACEHEAGVCFCNENNALNFARAAIRKARGSQ